MKKLTSKKYTIYINDGYVTMSDNSNQLSNCLSNLCICTSDPYLLLEYQGLGYDEKVEKLKEVALAGDVDKLNKLTGLGFIAA